MAGDFTQGASLTRLCQRTCHLQQTCQLTRMEFGIETDQFPNCQARRGSDSVTLFCQVEEKKKSTFCLGCIVNFSLFSLLLFIRHHELAPSLDAKVRQSGPVSVRLGTDPAQTFFFSALTLLPLLIFLPHRAVIAVYVHCLIMALIASALRAAFFDRETRYSKHFPSSK